MEFNPKALIVSSIAVLWYAIEHQRASSQLPFMRCLRGVSGS